MTLQKRLVAIAALVIIVVSACGGTATEDGGRSDLDLRADGIGPYIVGQPADEIIDALSASIGGPDADSAEPNSPLAVFDCGEPGVRVVSWGSLLLFFVERTGTSVFATWSYGFDPITGSAGDPRSLGLQTDEGVELGTPRQSVVDAYGLRVQFDDDLTIDLSTFTIDSTQPEHLAGLMTSTEADGEVQFLERVPACDLG